MASLYSLTVFDSFSLSRLNILSCLLKKKETLLLQLDLSWGQERFCQTRFKQMTNCQYWFSKTCGQDLALRLPLLAHEQTHPCLLSFAGLK